MKKSMKLWKEWDSSEIKPRERLMQLDKQKGERHEQR